MFWKIPELGGMKMQISNNFGVSAAEALQGAKRTNQPSFAQATGAESPLLIPTDQVEFSAEAQAVMAGGAAESTSRTERIASIRRAIADGSYDTPERMSAALDKFLEIHS